MLDLEGTYINCRDKVLLKIYLGELIKDGWGSHIGELINDENLLAMSANSKSKGLIQLEYNDERYFVGRAIMITMKDFNDIDNASKPPFFQSENGIISIGKNCFKLSKISAIQDLTSYYTNILDCLEPIRIYKLPDEIFTEIRLIIDGFEFKFSGKNAEFIIEEYKKYLENLKN